MARPMSPHLTIYSFPVPAILSISHRITGVALTGAPPQDATPAGPPRGANAVRKVGTA